MQKSFSELVQEGYKVNHFIKEFERQVGLSPLNLDGHWYGLLEICFKKTRTKDIKLYLWFTKRLYEGQTWFQAQALMKYHFGFDSPVVKQALQKLLDHHKRLIGKISFAKCYERFRPIAQARIVANFVEDAVLVRKILTCASDRIQRCYFADIISEYFAIKTSKETDWKVVHNCFNHEIKYQLLTQALNESNKLDFNWKEFDERVMRDVHQAAGEIEMVEQEEKAWAATKEKKKKEMKQRKAMKRKLLKEKKPQQLAAQQLAD